MIKLNRILASITAWINSLLWWREGEVRKAPFTLIRTWRLEGRGMVYQVRRCPELCPRDVGTIYFVPMRTSGRSPAPDLHICIDHIEGMARRPRRHTHQISVLLASHWPDRDGRYCCEELFCTTADLQGTQMRRDLNINCILYQMMLVLKAAPPEEINWPLQVAIALKTCMGSQSTGELTPRPPTVKGRILD